MPCLARDAASPASNVMWSGCRAYLQHTRARSDHTSLSKTLSAVSQGGRGCRAAAAVAEPAAAPAAAAPASAAQQGALDVATAADDSALARKLAAAARWIVFSDLHVHHKFDPHWREALAEVDRIATEHSAGVLFLVRQCCAPPSIAWYMGMTRHRCTCYRCAVVLWSMRQYCRRGAAAARAPLSSMPLCCTRRAAQHIAFRPCAHRAQILRRMACL